MSARTDRQKQFVTPKEGQSRFDLVKEAKQHAPWKPASVALIILSSDRHYVALCQPRKVADREPGDRIRVPLQGRMRGHNPDPIHEADRLVRTRLERSLDEAGVDYLGYGFGRHHQGRGKPLNGNKVIHWVSTTAPRDALPASTTYARVIEWVHVSAIPGLSEYVMEPQKRHLLIRALQAAARIPNLNYAGLRAHGLLELS